MGYSKYQKIFGVGPTGLLISLALFGLLWLLDRAYSHVEILSHPKPVRIIGFILVGIWICWHFWSIRTIRLWWFHDRLCTKGPYRFVRHPIYAGGIALAAPGICLICNSWIILFLPPLMYATLSILVRKEEAMMMEIFGDSYRAYAARTGRFFPVWPRKNQALPD